MAKYYKIAITETLVKEVEILADNEDDACAIANDLCNNDVISLGYEDFMDRDVECRGLSKKIDTDLHELYTKDGKSVYGRK